MGGNSHLFLFFYTMKRILLLFVLAAVAASCSTADKGEYLVINGTIDPSFDGYNMYFRPQPFPTADVVDSCKIKNGKFSFKISADTLSVGDVVLSFSSMIRVEPVLVAVEPGILTMEVGKDSRAWGTPLNDTLAVWKSFIETNLQSKRNEELIEARKVFNNRTAALIKSQPNALGGYLFFMFSPQFPGELVTELDSLKIYQYMPDVSKRRFKYKK